MVSLDSLELSCLWDPTGSKFIFSVFNLFAIILSVGPNLLFFKCCKKKRFLQLHMRQVLRVTLLLLTSVFQQTLESTAVDSVHHDEFKEL